MKLLPVSFLVLRLPASYCTMAQNMISMNSVHPVADTAGASKQVKTERYKYYKQSKTKKSWVYQAWEFFTPLLASLPS